MTLKITIEDTSLIDDFLSKETKLRVSGKGLLTDSWIISSHLREISEKSFGISLDETNITGTHLFINGDYAVVSGANFKNTETLEALSGKSFSAVTHGGRVSFEFGEVVEKFKFPISRGSAKTIPFSFFLNSVVFKIKKIESDAPDFYEEVTKNEDLLKELGRPLLPSGEVSLDCHMMDFVSELPERPDSLKSNIAKIFTSFL